MLKPLGEKIAGKQGIYEVSNYNCTNYLLNRNEKMFLLPERKLVDIILST